MPAIVTSHDCEWTKYLQANRAPDYKFGIAPLRRLSVFENDEKPGILGTISGNRIRHLFPLPEQPPLDNAYVVDLRLIQPMTVAELLEDDPWTCIGGVLKEAFQGKLVTFFTNLDLAKGES